VLIFRFDVDIQIFKQGKGLLACSNDLAGIWEFCLPLYSKSPEGKRWSKLSNQATMNEPGDPWTDMVNGPSQGWNLHTTVHFVSPWSLRGMSEHLGILDIERRRRGECLSCIYHSFAISALYKTVFFVHTQVLSLYGQFLVAFDTIVIMPS